MYEITGLEVYIIWTIFTIAFSLTNLILGIEFCSIHTRLILPSSTLQKSFKLCSCQINK